MFIVHECAHLAMQYTLLPKQNTPAVFFGDAGYFAEHKLFDGQVCSIIGSKIWDDQAPVNSKIMT